MTNDLQDVVGTIGKGSAELDRMKLCINTTAVLLRQFLWDIDFEGGQFNTVEDIEFYGQKTFLKLFQRRIGLHDWKIVVRPKTINSHGDTRDKNLIMFVSIGIETGICYLTGEKKNLTAETTQTVYDSLNGFMREIFEAFPDAQKFFEPFLDAGSK